MVVQDELAHAGPAAPAIEEPFSPAWWQNRSSDELRAIVQRGVRGGETFFAAAAELERRARESDAALRAEEVHVIADNQELKKLAWAGLIALPLAVAAILRLTGAW